MIHRLALILALCLTASAQTATLPTFAGGGVAFNQIGTPRTTLWITAIYPALSSIRMYTSTTADITPVLRTDPTTKRDYYAFTASIRQGLHRVVFTSGKLTFLAGGDAGIGMNQAVPSGLSMSFAGSLAATLAYEVRPNVAILFAPRLLWINSSWNVVPQIGVVFRTSK